MVKIYYRNEYTEKQWKALIDKATELGCHVSYAKSGDRIKIDSTECENINLKNSGSGFDDWAARNYWAGFIHGKLQESTGFRAWKVQPKRYHRDYCSTICKTQKSAEEQQEHLERITGFEWTITVIAIQ